MCPSAPAMPCAPSKSRPSTVIAPPIPVPTATERHTCRPLPAPRRPSAMPIECTSFRTTAGNPIARSNSDRRSSPLHLGSRSVATTTRPVDCSNHPPDAMPIADGFGTSDSAITLLSSPIERLNTSVAPLTASVATTRTSPTRPSRATIAAAIFVPPMSIAAAVATLTSRRCAG